MTQGQWYRATADVPSRYCAGTSLFRTPRVSRANPVENVDWIACARVLDHWGLALPTEAQWERGARGGTTRRYGTEDDFASIECEVNAADASLLVIQSKPV